MATGYLYHELYGWHDTGTWTGLLPADHRGGLQPLRHFENPEAKRRTHELVAVSGLLDTLTRLAPRPASDEDILRVHTPGHLARLSATNDTGGDAGDGGSPFGPGGVDIARLAAGGAIVAAESVVDGVVGNAYALVRPPGHHALPDSGMGFCLLANTAIAAAAVRATRGVRRIAVVDFDVHHGNGTEAAFRDDADTLTISIHQDGVFPPTTGGVDTTTATNLNIPLPAGTGNGGYEAAFIEAVLPALHRFRPELILVAAGYDAGATDPLARMMVTAAGYTRLTALLLDTATDLCDGRISFTHEGGYDPVYAPLCAYAVIATLAGAKRLPDPFAPNFDFLPGQALQPHQAAAITAATAAIPDVM
ncbi:Deacetylases, including yeast histone deacetylase and acetoin utilization protein [Alloactinosynnema sp. L-07]|uniref:class II histone deacetylase n=1 Tax=Alloactinosynnema sp. L-07 TaxID=1653480 RepID=UPI00065EF654|nr:class II histone deacetylase [Alloactinosynnema sp. L-07]CRK57856.1 Deacetylases, including yeast histone deacetylase and acetoin utilization protein [Alloactinosynnema sp. L-07]